MGIGYVAPGGGMDEDAHAEIDHTGIEGVGPTLIEEQVLGANAASITFSSIPQTFTHLRVIGKAWDTPSTGGMFTTHLRMNGDTGANYDRARITFDGGAGTVGGLREDGQTSISMGFMGDPAGPGLHSAEIPYYTDALHKTVHSTYMARLSAGIGGAGFNFGVWKNTAAITSLTILVTTGQIASGSKFQLWGL